MNDNFEKNLMANAAGWISLFIIFGFFIFLIFNQGPRNQLFKLINDFLNIISNI